MRLAGRLLRLFKYPQLDLATDSSGLAQAYAGRFGRPVAVLPFPHCPNVRKGRLSAPLTIGYLGTSYCDRGYLILPDLIVGILRRLPGVRLVVQSQLGLGGPRVEDAFRRICFLETEFKFEHIQGPVSTEKLDELLNEMSLILLPYSPEPYRDRTAGMFADAVGVNVVPVVTKGTWMAEQLAAIPEQRRLVAENSSRAFIDCARRFYADPDGFKESHREFSQSWRNRNTPENLLDRIISIPRVDSRRAT